MYLKVVVLLFSAWKTTALLMYIHGFEGLYDLVELVNLGQEWKLSGTTAAGSPTNGLRVYIPGNVLTTRTIAT